MSSRGVAISCVFLCVVAALDFKYRVYLPLNDIVRPWRFTELDVVNNSAKTTSKLLTEKANQFRKTLDTVQADTSVSVDKYDSASFGDIRISLISIYMTQQQPTAVLAIAEPDQTLYFIHSEQGAVVGPAVLLAISSLHIELQYNEEKRVLRLFTPENQAKGAE